MALTDHELTRLAARAAGIPRSMWDFDYLMSRGIDISRDMMWAPLVHLGDALALAIKQRITVRPMGGGMCSVETAEGWSHTEQRTTCGEAAMYAITIAAGHAVE